MVFIEGQSCALGADFDTIERVPVEGSLSWIKTHIFS